MNFQDVLREVYDGDNKALKANIVVGTITASSQVTVTLNNTPTIYAVVNTSAAGVGDSMVTINPRTDYFGLVSVSGNVVVSSLPATPAGANYIGLVTVANTVPVTFSGNVTLSDAKTYIGLTTTTIGNNPVLGAGVNSIGFATVAMSNPTIYAVVNTTASSGFQTVYQGGAWSLTGNVTLSDAKTYVGLVTATIGGSPVLGSGLGTIGFATVFVGTPTLYAVVNTGAPGTTDVTSDSGVTVFQGGTWTVTQASAARTITGNVTLSDSKGFIGLATVNIGSSNTVVLGSGVGNIGFATVNQVNQPALVAGAAYIGLASVNVGGTLPALAVGTSFIGLVTVVQSSAARTITGNVTLSDPKTFIGSVTAVVSSTTRSIVGNVTLSDAKTFIGLTTGWNLNAGTTKTLIPLTVNLSTTSVATIAVPTNANVIKVTAISLSANATVRVAIKSGVTYLNGNASIAYSLNPGGGLFPVGSPDSPVFIGCPSGALVIEKNDITTSVGGSLIYFQE